MVAPVSGANASTNTQTKPQETKKPEAASNNQQPKAPQQQPQQAMSGGQNTRPQGDNFSGGGIPKSNGAVSPLAGVESADKGRAKNTEASPDKGTAASNPFASRSGVEGTSSAGNQQQQQQGNDTSRKPASNGVSTVLGQGPVGAEGVKSTGQTDKPKASGETGAAPTEKPAESGKNDAKNTGSALDSAIQKKDWVGVKNQLSENIKNGSFKSRDLQQAIGAGADLTGMNFADLQKGELNNQTFKGATGPDGKPTSNLSNGLFPELKGTTFENMQMQSSDFRGSLDNVTFNNVNGDGSNFRESLQGTDNTLNNVKFNNSDFSHATFGDIKSNYPSFPNNSPAALKGVDAQNSKFTGSQFGGSRIEDSTFKNSDLSRSNMDGATLKNNQLSDNNFAGAILSNSTLSGNNLTNSNFSESTMQNTSLSGNQLKGADLRGAEGMETAKLGDKNNLEGAKYTDRDKLPAGLDPEKAGMSKTGTEGLSNRTKSVMESRVNGQIFPHVRSELDKMGTNPHRLPPGVSLAPVPPSADGKDLPGTRSGLAPTGSGREIAHIETSEDPEHYNNVKEVMTGNKDYEGLSPDVNAEHYSYQSTQPDLRGPETDSAQGLKDWMDKQGTFLLNDSTKMMKSVADRQAEAPKERPPRGPGLQVKLPPIMPPQYDATNQSEGWTKADVFKHASDALNSGSFPESAKSVYGDNASALSQTQRDQKLVDYIHGHLNPQTNPALKEAIAGHDQQAQRLLKQGTLPFVSMGNEHNTLPFQQKPEGAPADWKSPVNVPPGFDTNFLTHSPSVLGIGATDTQGTPSLKDDQMTDFSSHGNGQKNPFISAPGVNIPMRKSAWGETGTFGGTSAAAPFAASTAAMMREVNPNITAQQMMSAMQFTASPIPGASKDAQGAGSLDAARAIRLSRLLGEVDGLSPFQAP